MLTHGFTHFCYFRYHESRTLADQASKKRVDHCEDPKPSGYPSIKQKLIYFETREEIATYISIGTDLTPVTTIVYCLQFISRFVSFGDLYFIAEPMLLYGLTFYFSVTLTMGLN